MNSATKGFQHTYKNGATLDLQFFATYRPSHGKGGECPIGTVKVCLSSYPAPQDCTCTCTINGEAAFYAGVAVHSVTREPGISFQVGRRPPGYFIPEARLRPLMREAEAEVRAMLSPAWQAAYAALQEALPREPTEEYTAGPRQAAAWAAQNAYSEALARQAQAVKAFLASDAPEAKLCREAYARWVADAERAVM